MREFWNGWRRKAGGIALLLALVSMAGWIRSRSTVDIIYLNWKRSNVAVMSGSEGLRYSAGRRFQFLHTATKSGHTLRLIDDLRPIAGSSLIEIQNRQASALFMQNSAVDTTERFALPYWVITLPLTLLSAYLLLWSPPKSD